MEDAPVKRRKLEHNTGSSEDTSNLNATKGWLDSSWPVYSTSCQLKPAHVTHDRENDCKAHNAASQRNFENGQNSNSAPNCKSYAGDTLITLGTDFVNKTRITYNLSRFLRDYVVIGNKWHSKLETFVRDLDNKVRIDITDGKHLMIYDIDKVVYELFSNLLNKNGKKFIINLTRCGSMPANLRVGRPYEADLLLEVHDVSSKELLESEQITESHNDSIFECHNISGESNKGAVNWDSVSEECWTEAAKNVNINGWKIHAIKRHRVGWCLFLEYTREKIDSKRMGVLVDVVPIVPQSRKISQEKFSNMTSFFDQRVPSLDLKNYTLYDKRDQEFDVGYLEHQILKSLPDKIKRGYRIAKYLVQSQTGLAGLYLQYSERFVDISGELFRKLPLSGFYDTEAIDKNLCSELYGYQGSVKSHILHVFLMQLMQQTHVETEREQLQGSALTLCLLDMLHTTTENGHLIEVENQFVAQSELIRVVDKELDAAVIPNVLKRLACSLLEHAYIGKTALDNYNLLTQPSQSVEKEKLDRQREEYPKAKPSSATPGRDTRGEEFLKSASQFYYQADTHGILSWVDTDNIEAIHDLSAEWQTIMPTDTFIRAFKVLEESSQNSNDSNTKFLLEKMRTVEKYLIRADLSLICNNDITTFLKQALREHFYVPYEGYDLNAWSKGVQDNYAHINNCATCITQEIDNGAKFHVAKAIGYLTTLAHKNMQIIHHLQLCQTADKI